MQGLRKPRWKILHDEPEGKWILVGRRDWLERVFGQETLKTEEVLVVDGPDSLKPLIDRLAAEKEIFADTESSGPRPGDGLDPVSRTSEIVLLQLGVPGLCWLIEPALIQEFRPVLERGPYKIFQNAKHDLAFIMAKYGFLVWPVACTMLADQILQSTGVNLKFLSRRYPPHRVLNKQAVEMFVNWNGSISADMIRYAAMDVLVLPDIWQAQKKLLARYELQGIALLEFQNLPVAVEMTLHGVWLDRDRHAEMVRFHQKRLLDIEAEIGELYRKHRTVEPERNLFGEVERSWNLRSSEDKKQMLADCGIQANSSSAEELEMIGHPLALALVRFMAAAKIVDTYGERLAERVHPDTGRIHPKFDQLGAGDRAEENGKARSETISTGRWSSDFQQLPRPEYFYEPLEEEEAARVLELLSGGTKSGQAG